MINYLKTLLQKKHPTGVISDTRSAKEKQSDYNHEEVARAPVIGYVSKENALKKTGEYFKFNQIYTSSCVAHAIALAYLILTNPKFKGSPMSLYRPRVNYPGEGMIADDASKLMRDKGIADYDLLPTPRREVEANSIVLSPQVVADALKHRAKQYVYITSNFWQNVASMASQGTPVTIFIYATLREWESGEPQLLDKPTLGSAAIQHAITVLPESVFIENGTKKLIIQDSAWFGAKNIRILSEDFVNKRCYFGQYFTELQTAPMEYQPVHTFTRPIKYGERSMEVEWLQKCLVHQGLHPANCVTGAFFGITLKSVKAFQEKYEYDILLPLGLSEPTGVVGKATIAKLNQLYGTK